MASIKKTLSKKVNELGQAQVMFYIVMGRSGRFRIKSGVSVPVKYWNPQKENITIPQKIGDAIREELKQTQERLNISLMRTLKIIDVIEDVNKADIEHILFLLKDYDGTITANVVNDALAREAEEKRLSQMLTIYDVCEEFINKGFSESRIRMFRVVFRSMARYEIFRNMIANKPFVWNIDCVTKADMEDFFLYLENEHVYRKRYRRIFEREKVIYNEENRAKHKRVKFEARGENTLVDIRRRVNAFWNWLVNAGYTDNNPMKEIKIGVEHYGTPYFITPEERNIVADFDFSGNQHLETQRDIFVFHCLIGCRVGDLTKLTPSNVVGNVLIYQPHKTKDENASFTARVPLSERALAILHKYEGKDVQGRIFPFISDQKYNDAIKDVLTLCGIDRKVSVRNAKTGEYEMKPICKIASSHMARRTFVGNAYKIVKDPNIVGRMSGHVEGSKAFARYRDIDDTILTEVINAIQ